MKFVFDEASNAASIYEGGKLLSSYTLPQAVLDRFQLSTGEMAIDALVEETDSTVEAPEVNLYELTANLDVRYLASTKCNEAECLQSIISEVLRCHAGTAQVSRNDASGDFNFTCDAPLT